MINKPLTINVVFELVTCFKFSKNINSIKTCVSITKATLAGMTLATIPPLKVIWQSATDELFCKILAVISVCGSNINTTYDMILDTTVTILMDNVIRFRQLVWVASKDSSNTKTNINAEHAPNNIKIAEKIRDETVQCMII